MCICISAYNKAHNKAASCIKTNPLGKVCYKNKKIQAQDSIALAVNKSLPFFDFHKKSKINLVSIWLAVYFSLSQKVHLQSICICKAYFKCLKYCVFFFATFRLLHNSILKVIRLFSVILFYIFIYLVIKKRTLHFVKEHLLIVKGSYRSTAQENNLRLQLQNYRASHRISIRDI